MSDYTWITTGLGAAVTIGVIVFVIYFCVTKRRQPEASANVAGLINNSGNTLQHPLQQQQCRTTVNIVPHLVTQTHNVPHTSSPSHVISYLPVAPSQTASTATPLSEQQKNNQVTFTEPTVSSNATPTPPITITTPPSTEGLTYAQKYRLSIQPQATDIEPSDTVIEPPPQAKPEEP
ncbi:UNVERIFIED_CONTAM: hypothetical protein HDU68_002621, partial [Siphonaria sp. JEL0065]